MVHGGRQMKKTANHGETFPRDRLIIFGRYPIPGRTKTRLIPVLGPAGAAALQRRLTEKTLQTARTFAKDRHDIVECCFDGGTFHKIRRWVGPYPLLTFQKGGDVGERMRTALFDALRNGNKRVVLVGTDIPGMTAPMLKRAFHALLAHDVVLGPSTDGGYWLIGLKKPVDLFRNIEWSTPKVLKQTLAKIRRLNMTFSLLDYLTDVDTEADLFQLPPKAQFSKIFLSVVIPALNEKDHIHRSVASALDPDTEVIVVDGGSSDGTDHRAASLGATVISAPSGRALQQNAGARAATGENLLFLHADTVLPEGFVARIFDALMAPEPVLGAFRFKTDFHHPLMVWVEWMTNLRSKYLRLPYGDQALFMERLIFERVGAFPPVSIGEDLLLARRLVTGLKARVVVVDRPAVTSGRRWKTTGPMKTTWINQLILAGMLLGIKGKTLLRLYRNPSP